LPRMQEGTIESLRERTEKKRIHIAKLDRNHMIRMKKAGKRNIGRGGGEVRPEARPEKTGRTKKYCMEGGSAQLQPQNPEKGD